MTSGSVKSPNRVSNLRRSSTLTGDPERCASWLSRRRSPDPPAVLVVTMVDDDDTVIAAMRAGARGYVLKGASGADIAAAVRTVAAGGAVFGPGVAAQILARTSGDQPRPTGESDGLTDREVDVLTLLADGASNAQMPDPRPVPEDGAELRLPHSRQVAGQ